MDLTRIMCAKSTDQNERGFAISCAPLRVRACVCMRVRVHALVYTCLGAFDKVLLIPSSACVSFLLTQQLCSTPILDLFLALLRLASFLAHWIAHCLCKLWSSFFRPSLCQFLTRSHSPHFLPSHSLPLTHTNTHKLYLPLLPSLCLISPVYLLTQHIYALLPSFLDPLFRSLRLDS